MKRCLCPLNSVLLLMLVAATLAIRILLHHNVSFLLKYGTPLVKTQKPTFNATLLKYASIDIGESQLKQEIEELLEGNFRSRDRQRLFLSSGKYWIDISLRSARGIPLQLRSPEFYSLCLNFRKYLRDWLRNRKFHSDIMSCLVNEVKVLIDEYNGDWGSRRQYKSCAVVGNSGILLKSGYGKLIDKLDTVIRLNNARIASFERDVGAKTSISFVNSNILHLCARREVCNSSHKSPLVVTNPRFDLLCARIVKYYSLKRFVKLTGKDVGEWGLAHEGANFHYSSGMQAIMLASGICEKVSVFGFGKSKLAQHHYHTNQKAELSLHDYEAEYDFFRDLIKRPQVLPFISEKFKIPPVAMYH